MVQVGDPTLNWAQRSLKGITSLFHQNPNNPELNVLLGQLTSEVAPLIPGFVVSQNDHVLMDGLENQFQTFALKDPVFPRLQAYALPSVVYPPNWAQI